MAAEYAKGRYTLYSGLEFRHLRYFVAVAEECNFGRAALRLHLTQPSLSTQIKKLEDCIHATLFRRGRAGAELTSAGRHFLEAAKRLLHMSTLAFQSTSSVHSGINLPLRFGYSPFINHQLVEATVSGYRDLVPDGQIEPSSAGSAALIAMVAEGHLDAALVIMPIGDHKLFVPIGNKYWTPREAAPNVRHITTEESLEVPMFRIRIILTTSTIERAKIFVARGGALLLCVLLVSIAAHASPIVFSMNSDSRTVVDLRMARFLSPRAAIISKSSFSVVGGLSGPAKFSDKSGCCVVITVPMAKRCEIISTIS
jgi:DNA-binding transcriptional LysR family regulator